MDEWQQRSTERLSVLLERLLADLAEAVADDAAADDWHEQFPRAFDVVQVAINEAFSAGRKLGVAEIISYLEDQAHVDIAMQWVDTQGQASS